MVANGVALKSGMHIRVVNGPSNWHSKLSSHSNDASSSTASSLPSIEEAVDDIGGSCSAPPRSVMQLLSSLQREIMLLKNELNLELWMKRSNVSHVGRLYQDRLESKSAELERQGLVSTCFLSSRNPV